ncbi:MAG: DUF308 domain-containing protein [Lachnospiraceae bacterium]|nr:DUF308 domain-containing protein [Lachnospiraceae bacterium]
MESLLKKIKTNVVISSLVCVILGLVLVIRPGLSMRIVCTAVGVVLIVTGVTRMIDYFAARDGSMYSQINLIFGVILAVVGVWIAMKPDKVMAIIPIIAGIVIVIHGLHNVKQAMELWRDKYDKWWVACIMGVLTVGLGVLLICRPFTAIDTVVMMIGIFLIYDGLSNIWIVSRIYKNAKMIRQEMEAVEVEIKAQR